MMRHEVRMMTTAFSIFNPYLSILITWIPSTRPLSLPRRPAYLIGRMTHCAVTIFWSGRQRSRAVLYARVCALPVAAASWIGPMVFRGELLRYGTIRTLRPYISLLWCLHVLDCPYAYFCAHVHSYPPGFDNHMNAVISGLVICMYSRPHASSITITVPVSLSSTKGNFSFLDCFMPCNL